MTDESPAPAPAAPDYSKIKLDRSRPFDSCHPSENNAHFYQDHLYFTHGGELVVAMLDEHGHKALKRKTARAAAKKAAEEAFAKALVDAGENEADVAEVMKAAEAAGAEVVADPNAIDLIAWAKGQRKYVFGQIRKAFSEQHSKVISDKRDALEWLVDNGLIDEDDIAI